MRRMGPGPALVVTHEAPDGDAIGSLLATTYLLRQLGHRAKPLCDGPVPRTYAFLQGAAEIVAEVPAGPAPAGVVFVDCATISRAGRIGERLAAAAPGTPLINIDHHGSNDRFGTLNWVDPAASSTGEMVAALFRTADVAYGPAAAALYTAIVTDTGGFRFENTTPATHHTAAELLRAGVRPGEINDLIYGSRDRAALDLLAKALASLTTAAGDRVSYMVLTPADFAAAGATQYHTNGIVNYARQVAGVAVGLLLYSLDGDLVKVGIRTSPEVDASNLAARFGGGGHPRAAGCRLQMELTEAVRLLLAAAEEELPAE